MNFLIFIAILAILILWGIGIYNKYVSLDVENNEAFSNIGVFLQKRLDLIPNIVETVKGYAKHESETLEKVVQARSNFMSIDVNNIENLEKIQQYSNELTKTLRSIMALSEAYPDLKADTSFLNLQSTLQQIETELERARRYYNATAANLNVFIRKFPNVLLAGLCKFRKADLFKEEEEAKSAPKVRF